MYIYSGGHFTFSNNNVKQMLCYIIRRWKQYWRQHYAVWYIRVTKSALWWQVQVPYPCLCIGRFNCVWYGVRIAREMSGLGSKNSQGRKYMNGRTVCCTGNVVRISIRFECFLCIMLTHLPLDKIADISQTTPNTFSWINKFNFWQKNHSSCFLRV